jgi:hypothetical protein
MPSKRESSVVPSTNESINNDDDALNVQQESDQEQNVKHNY